MRINVFSLKMANAYLEKGMHLNNWISIRDKGWEHLYETIDLKAINVLPIVFDDITKYQYEHGMIHPVYQDVIKNRDIIYFDEDMAGKIRRFALDVYNNNNELNIHCFAGRSRSQAVGHVLNSYINLYFERNEEDYLMNLKNSIKKFMPNHDVLKILSENCFLY